MGFPTQEYWGALPFPPPWDPPDPGTQPRSAVLQADSLPPEPPGKDRKGLICVCVGGGIVGVGIKNAYKREEALRPR